MTTEEKIEIVRAQLKNALAKNHFISVDFIKKDGTLRHMTCHRAKSLESTVAEIPSEATLKRKATNKLHNNMAVEELVDGKHQFRTIPLERVVSFTANGATVKFNA